MNLQQVLESTKYTVSGGSEYGWSCWADARFIDFESDFAHASVVYSTSDQTIYQIEVNSKKDDDGATAYRWTNSKFKQAYLDESLRRGIDPDSAWDDVKWKDTEEDQDMLTKLAAIMEGREFDSRVTVNFDVNFDDRELLTYMLLAHSMDITFNALVEQALIQAIEKYENTAS